MKRPIEIMNAPGYPGSQYVQRRGCITIDTKGLNGLVATLPIEMFQVSSINLSVKTGDHVKKGQEISWLGFGESITVLGFEKNAKVKMLAYHNKHHLMGQKMCQLQSTE